MGGILLSSKHTDKEKDRKTQIIVALIGAVALIICAIIALFGINGKTNDSGVQIDSIDGNNGSIDIQQGDRITNTTYEVKNEIKKNVILSSFLITTETANANVDLALKYKEEDFTKAEEYYKLAINDYTKDLSPTHNDVARVKNNLGVLYAEHEDYELAEKCFDEAKTIFETNQNDKDIIPVECNIVNTAFMQEDDATAELNIYNVYRSLYERALLLLIENNQVLTRIRQNIEIIKQYLEEKGVEINNSDDIKDDIMKKLYTLFENDQMDDIWTIIQSDEFSEIATLSTFDNPIFYSPTSTSDNKNGIGIGIYGEYIYFGNYQDNVRSGHGKWVKINAEIDYVFDGMWLEDKPNGEGIEKKTFINRDNKLVSSITEGVYTNGLWNASIKLIFYERDENERILTFTAVNGVPVKIKDFYNDYYIVAEKEDTNDNSGLIWRYGDLGGVDGYNIFQEDLED